MLPLYFAMACNCVTINSIGDGGGVPMYVSIIQARDELPRTRFQRSLIVTRRLQEI